jgi:zinc protease
MFVKRWSRYGIFLFLLPALAHAVPEIHQWSARQGARVYHVQTEGLPMLDLRVVFDAGSARDGAEFGLAALTSNLLDTGAGEWDADAIAQRLEGVGANVGTGVSRDMAWVTLRSLTSSRHLETALETVREILTRPRFAQSDFDREKHRVLLSLKQREESPSELAGIAFFSAAFGDHPYAHPKDGTIDTVDKLVREDLERFYRLYYVAKNAVVVVVGDIKQNEAKSLVDDLLQGLPEGDRAPELPEVQTPAKPTTVRQAFPSEQTHIFSGLPGMRVNDPDYFPLFVGNHILGGSGLISRISSEVREKRGLSYSAYSYFYPLKRLGPFLMGLQTRNDQADQALDVMLQTLRDFIAKGPTTEELKAAKQNITGGFAMRIDSNSKLTENVANIAFYGLPLDYLNTFTRRVEGVTIDAIRHAFKNRIDPNKLQTVLLGGAMKAVRSEK